MSREEERDVALVLRFGVARLGVAMAMRDRAIDRLVEKDTELVW